MAEPLNSILHFLPPLQLQPPPPPSPPPSPPLSPPTITWRNPKVVASIFEKLSKGPVESKVNSGEDLFNTIVKLREALSLNSSHLRSRAGAGYALYFEEQMTPAESEKFFSVTLPVMAKKLFDFPIVVQEHYSDHRLAFGPEVETRLRLLEPQRPGIVLLSQELIAGLLASSFFCLFPGDNRIDNGLLPINCDYLFAFHENHKLECLIHYFERVCSSTPLGFVSFERKVLSMDHSPVWAKSVVPLCRFEVYSTGAIEDHSGGSLEVDFADKYLGGLTLTSGDLQEEIRFMINPELIAGMLFLPSMADNEAIEMVGAERFSNYTGYGRSFRFSANHVDKRQADSIGRRMTRIIAIDALEMVGARQYELAFLLREVNKAFCGFLDQNEHQQQEHQSDNVGVITGNWGCGVFGGDPEVKTMIQWIAASQASRPFIAYYTFGLAKMEILDQVRDQIISKQWTVGDLWNRLVDYCTEITNGETKLGFFKWLLQSMDKVAAAVRVTKC